MTRTKAQRILSAAMDGKSEPQLGAALDALAVTHEEFDRCRKAALKVTHRLDPREALAVTETGANRIHGLDSMIEYESANDGDFVPRDA